MGMPAGVTVFDSRELERVFNACFQRSENTILQGGAAEPLYQPALTAAEPHTLYYREDFFASALHEIAHWCIAGAARRRLRDFGYWYAPEGRSALEQGDFERVEVKPQALEWIFARACGYRFQVSVDNLDPDSGQLPDTRAFREAVLTEAMRRQREGLPPRAALFFEALGRHFATGVTLPALQFTAADLSP